MPVSSVTEHWIKQDAIIINLNHFGDPDYLQVSVLAGAVVMAFKQDVIGYNAARNYRTWPLQAANTFLETTDALNVYARLTRSEVNASALIIYDPLLRDIEGRSISYADDGSEVLGEADEEYYYIYLGQISSSINADGNEIEREWSVDFRFGNLDTSEQNNFSGLLLEKMFKPHYEDKTNPNKLTSIEALAGLWTEQFLSAKGLNSGGSDEPTGGATTLGGLRNVAADADKTFNVAKMLVLEADSNLWTLKNLSELVGGLDEAELAAYLTNNNYAKKGDIPSLSGYATEQWVLGKGYLTEHQDLSAYAKKTDIPTIPTKVSAFENDANYATTTDLDNRIDALVNGAPQAYDTLKEIADVLAGNVNSISDILTALGNKADKATTLSGYGITDAYTITQIDNIVSGLSGNITTLQGYFTDGVANSALKLSDNGSYTAWGQTFFTNGKPKSVSGALTGVTDIASSGTITTNKIVIGNGSIEWDDTNKGFKIVGGLYTESYLSAKGANTNGGSSSGGGLIESLYRYADLGKTFSDTNNDTFNAYTINKINSDLGSRISVLEGKATNVSFTQSLTSGTQIGVIAIDGVSKNIYAPTIPTSDINKGVTAYGWGNHATMGYITASANITGNAASASLIKPTTGTGVASSRNPFTSYTKIWGEAFSVSSLGSDTGDITLYLRSGVYTKNSAELCVAIDGDFYAQTGSKKVLHEGNYTDYTYSKSTIDSKFSGLGTFAYKSSLAFADLTNKPTTLSGYGITDAYTKAQVDSALGGYLPLSGGTMTGSLNFNAGLSIKSANNTVLEMYSGVDTYLRGSSNIYLSAPSLCYIDSSNTIHSIIHSGNIGSQSVSYATSAGDADTLGGIANMRYAVLNTYYYTDNTNADNLTRFGCHINATGIGSGNSNFPTTYGKIFSWGGTYGYVQMYASVVSDQLCYRASATSLSGIAWKTIAFTDSNVSSATKLQTARRIWGQSFNGENDVNGHLSIGTIMGQVYANRAELSIVSETDIPCDLWLGNSAGNVWSINCRPSTENRSFSIYHGSLGHLFRIDGASGNVGIGTTSPQYNLHVKSVAPALMCESTASESSIYFSASSENAYRWAIGKGVWNIGGDFGIGEYNTAKKIFFRIAKNGNVGIGLSYATAPSYKLHINGTLHASDAVSFGSTLDVTGAITKPTTSGSNMTSNYISAGGGSSSGTGKYGVKILCCDQADAQTGLGQDLGGFSGGYELSVVGGTSSAGQGYISFVTHGVNSTSYRKLGYFYDNKGVISFDVLGTIHSTTGIYSDGYVSAKGQNTSSDMRLKNVLNEVVLGVKDIANAPSIRFAWKNGGGVDVGSSAQYWQGLLPDAVKERDGMLEMQYANIALLSAIALAKNFETHEERIARLEKENEELRTKIDMMERGIA